jgi:tetratricopeptide (TPR) repeat protein
VRVVRGEPAASAGIEPGDVVNQAQGNRVATARDLLAILANPTETTRQVALGYLRGQNQHRVTVPALPSDASRQLSRPADGSAGNARPAPTPSPRDSAELRGPGGVAASSASSGNVVDDMVEANRHYEAGSWAEAETLYARIVESVADVPLVLGRLCPTRVALGRFAAALETCRQAAKDAPQDPIAHQNLGYAYWRLGRYAEAIPEYQQVIERDPGNQPAWQTLGDVTGEMGRSSEAIAHYRKALELGPGNAGIYRALGWQLYRSERFTESETALTEAARLNPSDANILVTLGNVKYKLGKPMEARSAWQRAVQLAPYSPTGAIARKSLDSVGGEGISAQLPDGQGHPIRSGSAALPEGTKPPSPGTDPGAALRGGEPEFDPGN